MPLVSGYNATAGSALQLLSGSSATSGIFSALTSRSSIPSPTISALGVSNPSANSGQTVQQIVQAQSIQTQKNGIYKTIADRISAIAKGQLTPSAEWEKLGGYYAATGKPFVVSLDSKGQPAVTSQDQADASRYSATQRSALSSALTTLQTLAPEVKANADYQKQKNLWNSISVNLVDIHSNHMVPTTDWQQQAAVIMSANHPIAFSLSADGKVSVEDQTTSTFQDQDPAVRNVLIKASRMVADAVSTQLSYNAYLAKGASPPRALQDKLTQYSQYSWVQEAASYAAMGVPYQLGADPTQLDTSVNYVNKTERTSFSDGRPDTINSYTVNQHGVDGFGYPDSTTDAASPQPFAATNRITTTIVGLTDANGAAITPIKYTNPVTVVSSAADALSVTDTVTGNTDAFAYDSTAGTVTVTTTNKAGNQIGTASYSATRLSAIASGPPTVTVVDGAGKTVLAGGSGLPVTYTSDVAVKKVDANTMTVTDAATGNVDTYSVTLDSSGNPLRDAKGNYQLTLTHTDSLGRSISSGQTFALATAGVNGVVVPESSLTIAADGANTATAISKTTILPIDKYASAVGSNGNKLASSITDGSGKVVATYTDPVSIANSGAGTIAVTNKQTGNVDTYTALGASISITHQDSAGDVIAPASTAAGTGLDVVVSQTPTFSLVDGSGAVINDSRGIPLPSYSNPVTVQSTGSGADKSVKVTDAVTGYYDTYAYSDSAQSLTVSRFDNTGKQLSSLSADGVAGFAVTTTPQAIGVVDASGAAVLDAGGTAPPSYTSPVTFKDTGTGSFTVTDSLTGAVDSYAYDSAAQTLSITRADQAGKTLSTQSFSGVAGITKPWTSLAVSGPASWTVTPPPTRVTDAAGNALTDANGQAAPSYANPVSVADAGNGSFTVTDSAAGIVDQYAYDSAGQTLTLTRNDASGNTLSTQSFGNISGIKTPWGSSFPVSPSSKTFTPTPARVTDAAGNALTDANGQAAPTYSNPVTVADAGNGSFTVTDSAAGTVDQYAYDSAAQTLSLTRNDASGNTLSTQSFSGVSGIKTPWGTTFPVGPSTKSFTPAAAAITDAAGNALVDGNGQAAPSYANPVSVADAGNGSFTVTDSAAGIVDQYAYDSAGQTLTLTRNDASGNTLSTQSFSGVSGIKTPWGSVFPLGPTTQSFTPTPATITDSSGNALTDANGQAAPSYTGPVSIADAGNGSFTVTDTTNGIVDQYAYDSAAQALTLTRNDASGNTLSTQSFGTLSGFKTPWGGSYPPGPTSKSFTPTPASVTDGAGKALVDDNGQAAPSYGGPLTIADAGNGSFTVTDSAAGTIDQYAYDSVGQSLTLTRTDTAGNTLSTQNFSNVNGIKTPWGSQQAAVPVSQSFTPTPATITDASGNAIVDGNGLAAPTYAGPMTVTDSGNGKFSITDSATGAVDQYAYDSVGQTLTITRADSAGNTLATLNYSGVNGLRTPWAAQEAANPASLSFNPPATSMTDGSGNTLIDGNGQAAPTYANPVSVVDDGNGNITVSDSVTGNVDQYTYDSTAQTLNISRSDSSGNLLSSQDFSGVSGLSAPWSAGPNPVSFTPVTSAVTDASGNPLTDGNGQAPPVYTNPITVTDSGNGSFSVTDTVTGTVDQYLYDSAAQSLAIARTDSSGNTLSTQSFGGVTGIATPWAAQQAANPLTLSFSAPPATVTDAAGATLVDGSGQVAPTYANPVTVATAGDGSFTVTDSLTGAVDQYAYDSAAQTLSITRSDSAGNTLSTQSFGNVSGLTTPWVSQQPGSGPTNRTFTPAPIGVTDFSGALLTDANGQAAPSYGGPVTIADAGNGSFTVTDTTTGGVDQYAYDSAGQTLSLTRTDASGNTLATQDFSGVSGFKTPWGGSFPPGASTRSFSPAATSLTDAAGTVLTDSNGQAAPSYSNPVSVADAGNGSFTVTDSAAGTVDQYVYDPAAQTLSLTRNDTAGNTLSTHDFSNLAGFKTPWGGSYPPSPSIQTFTPSLAGVTDSSGAALADANGQAAPRYANPVSVADAGNGSFTVTDATAGTVDQYVYDSAAQTLRLTRNDTAGNTLSTQDFSNLAGFKTPWGGSYPPGPATKSFTLTPDGITDASGNALTDSNGQAAPSYANPVSVADAGNGSFTVTDATAGTVDQYVYDSAAQTLRLTRNDTAGNTLSTQNFSNLSGIKTPWGSSYPPSLSTQTFTPTPLQVTDGAGNALNDLNGKAAPTYGGPVTVANSGGGAFTVTDTASGAVDRYLYDGAAQTLNLTRSDGAGNTLSTQSFSGVSGIGGLQLSQAALTTPVTATWDVFNKTTLHSTLTSSTAFTTSYDSSAFDFANPSSHVNTTNAYTSTTSIAYSNINVGNPSLLQSSLPNLKLNYVATPNITVTPQSSPRL